MVDTFIPMVQIECNQIPSRHEQGIPRFINRSSQPVVMPGVQVNIPQSGMVNGFSNTVIGQNPSFPPQQTRAVVNPTMPHVPPATVSLSIQQPHNHQGLNQCVINKSQSPPSPSISSTVSGMSVYEDCVSIQPTSPRQQPDPFFYQPFLHHSFDPSGDQPKQNHDPVKSLSLSSIPSGVDSSGSNQWTGHQTCPSSQTSAIKPEQAMAMVNEKLRDRIATLEKKIHSALAEVTFLGDRNWRLEAHVDSLMHTLEVLGVTDIEDLTGKTLPLPMFRVKVKAGYRLGPFNRLPRRAVWSYDEDCKEPPNIDFSLDRARTLKGDGAKMFHGLYDDFSSDRAKALKGDDRGSGASSKVRCTKKRHFLEITGSYKGKANIYIVIIVIPLSGMISIFASLFSRSDKLLKHHYFAVGCDGLNIDLRLSEQKI